MQIIIDIPKSRYNEIVSGIFDADGYFKTNLTLAFRNGTVLPKHGRLIDVDMINCCCWLTEQNIKVVSKWQLDNAPTILEADMVEPQESEE